MGNAKFTLNAFILVLIIAPAIVFFFTVALVDFANHPAINEYHPIEGTDAAVCYRSLEPSGIYEGDRVNAVLKLEGEFGFDWGLVREGDILYTNEYTRSALGLIISQVVRIDLKSYEKEVLLSDAILRGRCASGELVCLSGTLLPSANPGENSLCRLYALSAPWIDPEGKLAEIVYLDPASGRELLRLRDSQLSAKFEQLYLQRTLEEVRP